MFGIVLLVTFIITVLYYITGLKNRVQRRINILLIYHYGLKEENKKRYQMPIGILLFNEEYEVLTMDKFLIFKIYLVSRSFNGKKLMKLIKN